MKRPRLINFLMTVSLIALMGGVGAQTYYTYELAHRLSQQQQEEEQFTTTPIADNQMWDPWVAMHDDMLRMRAQMDELFQNRLKNPGPLTTTTSPAGGKVTMQEQGDNYLVRVNIPGANENDIKVDLDGRMLNISSQTQGSEQQTTDDGHYSHQEHYMSAYQQTFALPGPVDDGGMQSHFKDGVLTLTIPKATS